MVSGTADVLARWPLASLLGDVEREALAAIAEPLELPAGREFFREGDPGDGVYLVVSGEVEITKRTRGGERALARLGAGSVLGEMSLLTAEPRSASARTLVPTAAIRLPAPGFRRLLETGSSAALRVVAAIAVVLAQRLAATNAKVVELSERLDGAIARDAGDRDEALAALHRSLQVWSF